MKSNCSENFFKFPKKYYEYADAEHLEPWCKNSQTATARQNGFKIYCSQRIYFVCRCFFNKGDIDETIDTVHLLEKCQFSVFYSEGVSHG